MLTSHSEKLIDVVATTPVWHCAIHGTVSVCPFRFLRCDIPATTQDAAQGSGRGWLKSLRETETTAKGK